MEANGRRRALRHAALLAPLVLYAAALNPYLLPATFDNVVFFEGGRELAQSGTFTLGGEPIVDWGPGLPFALSLLFRAGIGSVVAAKALILACVGLALVLTLRLLEEEERPRPLLTCVLFAVLPVGFSMGTRIMTEWPYVFLSMSFLGLLHRLEAREARLAQALPVGLLLGAASLTRFAAVMLGAAVIAQAVGKLSARRAEPWPRVVAPEAVVAVLGASIFLAWRARCVLVLELVGAESTYYPPFWYLRLLSDFSLTTIPARIADLFLQASSVATRLGLADSAMARAPLLLGVLALAGLALQLRSPRRRSSDWYVLATLVVFAAIAEDNQQPRYLLPVAPFLIGYTITAGRWLGAALRMPAPWFRRLGLAAAAGWVAAAVMLDLHAVVFGNATRLHGGLSPLASPDARSFYQGEWLELHDACQAIVADGLPGPVCTTSQKHKYILAFTRRTVCDYPPTGPVAYILTEAGRQPGIPTEVERGAVPLVLGARYSVYRVGAVPRGAEPNRAAAPSPADSR